MFESPSPVCHRSRVQRRVLALIGAGVFYVAPALLALERPETTYPIFQFPADRIPRIDGDAGDWSMVPASYVIGADQLVDHSGVNGQPGSPRPMVRVRVGWVKGLNRLYFLYEADDDVLDFAETGLHNDTFEVMVDGDASGGALVDPAHGKNIWTTERMGSVAAPEPRIAPEESHWAIHGVQAQNYHAFAPAVGKDWCLAWGAPTWVKELPWANAAQTVVGRHGGPGKVTLEFWITPFDYAGPEGPPRAVESVLRENKVIGLGWAIIDYDGPEKEVGRGFWTLSPKRSSFGHASELCAFRLMPVEAALLPEVDARWSWRVVDMERRLVAFKDESVGAVTVWKWDFGDGTGSTEASPEHRYAQPGSFVVVLEVTGPAGASRRSKVWDVQLR